MDITTGNGYSANVELTLLLNGSRLGLSHVGRDMFIFREAQAIAPASVGTLVVKIDESERHQKVELYDGATLDSKRVNFRRC